MRIYAYYLTQRPATPGAMPMDGILSVENFNSPLADGKIKRIWAKVSYSRQLSKQEISDYELTPVPEKKENRGQHKVINIRDRDSWYIAIRNDNDRYTPYRVYRMIDKWHRRQIAKCECLAMAIATILDQVRLGR